jgi:hypothetical protein
MTDDDVAALAAEIALTYPGATGDGQLHALNRETTLCGVASDAVERQEDPFSPLAPTACATCASSFAAFAELVPALDLAAGWKDMRPRSGYHNQLKQQFAVELEAELADDHPLTGAAFVVVANAEDDVVLALADGRAAVVRLTWSREPEAPPKPVVAFLDGVAVPPASDLALDA